MKTFTLLGLLGLIAGCSAVADRSAPAVEDCYNDATKLPVSGAVCDAGNGTIGVCKVHNAGSPGIFIPVAECVSE